MTQLCRWVGSKRAVLAQIFAHIPRADGALYIPFLGGGSDAMYALEHGWAKGGYYLSDCNLELVTTYRMVRTCIDDVMFLLRSYADQPTTDGMYLSVRNVNAQTLDSLQRAARFLFLVGTSFNGLWRENQSGKMNTPYGQRQFTLNDDRIVELRAVSRLLRTNLVSVACRDFEETIGGAGDGDIVYCDPPYIPTSPTSSFASYSSKRFDLDEHRRLYRACHDAARRGARVFVSNSDTPTTREIYHCHGDSPNPVHVISAPRRVSAKASGRGTVSELLIEIRA